MKVGVELLCVLWVRGTHYGNESLHEEEVRVCVSVREGERESEGVGSVPQHEGTSPSLCQ